MSNEDFTENWQGEPRRTEPSWSVLERAGRYRSSVDTDVRDTWRRFGWRPGRKTLAPMEPTPFDGDEA